MIYIKSFFNLFDSFAICFSILNTDLGVVDVSESNAIRTHNHVVRKWTLNHLAKLAILINWLVWQSGLVFIYEQSCCGFEFESRCCHFRYDACFSEKGVP